MTEIMRNKLSGHYHKYAASWFTRDDPPSDLPVAIMVPLAPKDIDRARRSIPEIQRHIAHPVERFVIAAPDHPDITALCRDLGIDRVDEMEPLTALVGAEAAREMNGWIKQQMLKLMADRVTGCANVIAIDSDTYPIRPTAFARPDGRPILLTAPPDQTDYHSFTEALIGPTPARRTSYIAHCMLFQAPMLAEVQGAISAHHGGKDWASVIVETLTRPYAEVGILSEFDLYGHYMLRTHPDRFDQRSFSNLKVNTPVFLGDAPLPGHARRFRFLSNHQHGS